MPGRLEDRHGAHRNSHVAAGIAGGRCLRRQAAERHTKLGRRLPHLHQCGIQALWGGRAARRQDEADEKTGRLKTTISENPQIAFSEFILTLSNDGHTPLANPLVCGPATVCDLLPLHGAERRTGHGPVHGGVRHAALLAFPDNKALPTTGGSTTSFTLDLGRNDGQQYLQKVSATLPAGMVAKIPSVPQCGEPAAKKAPARRPAKSARLARALARALRPTRCRAPCT